MKQSVKISEDTSGRITVDFPYNPVYIEKVKAIKGYKWHLKEKHWSFPYSDGVIDRQAVEKLRCILTQNPRLIFGEGYF